MFAALQCLCPSIGHRGELQASWRQERTTLDPCIPYHNSCLCCYPLIAHSCVQAWDANRKLQASLRQEQSLLVQRMAMLQQRLLLPAQVAVAVVRSYPLYPDSIALTEAVARRFPSEPSAMQLLGLGSPSAAGTAPAAG